MRMEAQGDAVNHPQLLSHFIQRVSSKPVLGDHHLRPKLQEGQHNHVAFTQVLEIQTPVLTLVQKRLTTEPPAQPLQLKAEQYSGHT